MVGLGMWPRTREFSVKQARKSQAMCWRPITHSDVPDLEEFKKRTLQLLRSGITNADQMRDAMCRERKLILEKTMGDWKTPSGKFVNGHAWSLVALVKERIIVKSGVEKEYRLVSGQAGAAPVPAASTMANRAGDAGGQQTAGP